MAAMKGFSGYRTRLAPTPSGYLHLGHARAFAAAWHRAREMAGRLVLRIEDIDLARCKPEYFAAALDDLRWLGFDWQEGPDVGGFHGPYVQSERFDWHRDCLERLRASNAVYPCACSRRDLAEAPRAPHDEETLYPGTCRPGSGGGVDPKRQSCVWRFRVPEGRTVRFRDRLHGDMAYVAGKDFGDFIVWRREDLPAYQLAVVADDHAMGITEVIRGADLLVSTARQILLYEALQWEVPAWAHFDLIRDRNGRRLSKRENSWRIRELRADGWLPEELLREPMTELMRRSEP